MTIVLISLQLILLAEDLLKLFLTLDLKGCSLYERLLRQIKIRDSFIVRDRLIDFLDLLPDYVADLIFGDIAVNLGHFLIRILDLNCDTKVCGVAVDRLAEYEGIGDLGDLIKKDLDLFGEGLLTVLKNDHILLSSCQEDIAVFIHIAQIACMEPPVDDDFICELFILIVSCLFIVLSRTPMAFLPRCCVPVARAQHRPKRSEDRTRRPKVSFH